MACYDTKAQQLLDVCREWEIAVPEEGTRKEKVAVVMQSLATVFEKGITEHPEDWHMLQRLWLEDLEPGAVGEQ